MPCGDDSLARGVRGGVLCRSDGRRRNKTARSRTGRAPACVRHVGKGMGHKTRAEEKQELDRAGLHRPREEGWLPFQERWQPPLGFEQASLCFSKITL